jgi:hypothetical protein
MTDIADKIYAATGLTLNAEAAAKVGHMIRLARRAAMEEAARRLEELHRNHKYNPQTGEGSEHDAGYYRAISEGAAWICALGEKE